ncbi:MAG TPA: dihydroneopterin aldolase [Ferruginibacter sp.]|jgi:dihydroneopterin aldolase|nr:dihydroneopterin aldolase [Ferruginibacter sp.]
MITVHLHNLQFAGFHGIHDEERVLGNTYELTIDATVNVKEHITQLHQTADYVTIYEIVKKRMAVPSALLETVAQDLTDLIHAYDNRITSVSVSIKKLNPPIINFQGSVGVSYKKEF